MQVFVYFSVLDRVNLKEKHVCLGKFFQNVKVFHNFYLLLFMFHNVQIYHKNIFKTTMYPYKFGQKSPPHDLRSSYATAGNMTLSHGRPQEFFQRGQNFILYFTTYLGAFFNPNKPFVLIRARYKPCVRGKYGSQ